MNSQKVCSRNKFKKWNAFVTDEFPSETLVLWKRLSIWYTMCIQFFHNPLNFLAHAMWVKLWYYVNFQPFQSSFAMLFNFRVILDQNKSWNAWKIANEVRKGLKSDDVASNGAYWMHKKSGVEISLKKWNAFVTDEFSSETLLLRKRLSILYTKCIQFLP